MPFGVFSTYSGSGFEVHKLDFPAARRYDVLLRDKIPDRDHVLRGMDVAGFAMSALTRVRSLLQRNVILLSTARAPFGCRNPFVEDNDVVKPLQLGLYRSHARVLYLLPVSVLLPAGDLFILDDDFIVELHHVDELVGKVLLLVCYLLVLSSDYLVSSHLVVRTLFLSGSLLLEPFQAFAFLNLDVNLSAVREC